MCKISNSLKLCSCNSNINKLKNYWELYRFDEKRNMYIIGEIMIPAYLSLVSDEDNEVNILMLRDFLNKGNVFDFDAKIKNNDRLLLAFKCKNEVLKYGFEFNNNLWSNIEYCTFIWREKHLNENYGSIDL